VVQTAVPPPNQGRIRLATIGWTWKMSQALRATVAARRKSMAREEPEALAVEAATAAS
jgi:hypothetical protein